MAKVNPSFAHSEEFSYESSNYNFNLTELEHEIPSNIYYEKASLGGLEVRAQAKRQSSGSLNPTSYDIFIERNSFTCYKESLANFIV